MNYKSISVSRLGGPEVMQVIENELRPPAAGEVRIKVLAASVSRPDVTVRSGKALYSGTRLGQKLPFVPGYSIIGEVEALGEGVQQVGVGDRVAVLTIIGGYSEVLYWRSDRLIPFPAGLDPVEAVPLVLNYIVAYQTMFRSLKAKRGETALIIGASGGIGSALLDLGRLTGLKMYGLASPSKHDLLRTYGAAPLDYREPDWANQIRQAEPGGIDLVFDGMMDWDTIQNCLGLLRRGGRLVSFGEPSGGLPALFRVLGLFFATNLIPNGKSYKLYGTSTYFLFEQKTYLEDWATLFKLLGEGKIKPLIQQKFPILEAARAQALLESGQVSGNVVLAAPELL